MKCQGPHISSDIQYEDGWHFLRCRSNAKYLVWREVQWVRRLREDGSVIPFRERKREPLEIACVVCENHRKVLTGVMSGGLP